MQYPSTLSSKEIIGDEKKYIFISYSHDNMQQVYEDLFAFCDAGINYWYDKELCGADAWDEKVKSVLCSPNCVGVLFFLSPQFVASGAIQKEIEVACKLKSERDDFLLASVSISGQSVNCIVRDTYLQYGGMSDRELNMHLPQNRIAQVLNVFQSNIIYFDHTSDDMTQCIVDTLEAKGLDIVYNHAGAMKALAKNKMTNTINGDIKFNIGKIMQSQRTDITYLGEGRTTVDGVLVQKDCNMVYAVEDIEWDVLYANGNIVTLISHKALDVIRTADFDSYKDNFMTSAFEESIASAIRALRLPTVDEIVNHRDKLGVLTMTDYALSKKTDGLEVYPTSENVGAIKCKAVNKNGIMLNVPVRLNQPVSLRLILDIDINILEAKL